MDAGLYAVRRRAGAVGRWLGNLPSDDQSAAHGAQTSDIDLMVIGDISGRELAKLLSTPKRTLGREINVVTMPPAEFREKIADRNPFVSRVLQEPKVFLIGGEDELREISGRRSVEAAQDPQG